MMKRLKKNKKGLQLSNMIIGLLITVAITMGFFVWLSDGITQYASTVPSDYNSSFLRIQGIYGNLSSNINQSYEELQDVSSQTEGVTVVDFLSFFFNAGYRSAKIAALSITSMFSVGDAAVSVIPLGSYADLLKGLLFLGIIVIFAIGILLNFIIKSGRE